MSSIGRLDALSVRESNGKSFWTKIGVAFPSKDGSGYSVLLDAIPAPTEGQFKIMLRPPQDGGNVGGRGQTRDKVDLDPITPDDDGVPF